MTPGKPPVSLACAICGRPLLAGEVFVMLTGHGLAFTMCRPAVSLACLRDVIESTDDTDLLAFRFLDPRAAHDFDEGTAYVDRGGYTN